MGYTTALAACALNIARWRRPSTDHAMNNPAQLMLLANGQTPDWMKFALMVMAILVGSFYAMYKWYHH